jgi:hypothetical protein
MIGGMPDEDEIDIPDEWRYVVHPRRHGMAALVQTFDYSGHMPGSHAREVTRAFKSILDHSNPALALLARPDEQSVTADALRLALATVPVHDRHGPASRSMFADLVYEIAAERGLVHAAAAFVASGAYYVRSAGAYGQSLVPHSEASDSGDAAGPMFWDGAAKWLRYVLAVAPQEVYDDVAAALSPLREGLLRQRIAASYLMPDMRDWVTADFADLPADYGGPGKQLFYSAATAEQLSRFTVYRLDDFVTAYDAVGNEVAPLLVRWLAQVGWSHDARRDALEVLTRIPTDAAFDSLLRVVDWPDVAAGVLAAGDLFPRRAARMLASRRDGAFIDVLFLRHVRSHPGVPEAGLVARLPDAPAGAVPALLASPPWNRKPPARVTVSPSPLAAEPQMAWREGEREQWAGDQWSYTASAMRGHLPLARTGDAPAEFYIHAPADLVRPHLAAWKAESAWFYLQKPQVIVAKYELDALAPMLRLARRKPVVGAGLLMPYLAQEVADLMAEWLTRSRQFRPVAREWFARHGAVAAALLIPAALGAPPPRSRTAALALGRIDVGDVLAAAGELGCRDTVQGLLDRDPLDLVPARIPAVPAWADPEFLPQVLLAGGTHALSPKHTAALLRMTAMSQLDAPYEGLRLVAGQCDPGSLSLFAWALYRLWESEGRPSKDAWAMDCLGYFGDDTVADRLAPLVRAWPSEGAATRAKRGADVLAAMGGDRALGHLSALARTAKSTPLRAHAAAALDRVAADRGLLPEQLDDLVAPDLGLDGDPVDYRGVCYKVELDVSGTLILQDPAGQRLTTLPKPADDDQKAAASAWSSRRRKASSVIADQTARLEEAMIVQRQWSSSDFRGRIAAHPLLGRLARRLVWVLGDRTVALDAIGDLVDPAGGLARDGEWVRLAHPAVDDFAPWQRWLARQGAPQPFPQAERAVFPGEDPSAYWGRVVEPAALYSLLRHGWRWGPAGQHAMFDHLFRPFGAQGHVVLTIDPGTSATFGPEGEPQQTITELIFQSSEGDLGVFSDLPLVTRSELIRSLRALD